MNNKQVNRGQNKNSVQKKSNLKPLIFTFLGTFIVFFFAFTVLLPIMTPQVDIPALTNEHSMSSVTSNDFKGRIDPRLNSIKDEENAAPAPKLKMEIPKKDQTVEDSEQSEDQQVVEQQVPVETSIDEPPAPEDAVSEEGYRSPDSNINAKAPASAKKPVKPSIQTPKTSNRNMKPSTVANIPPRPQQIQPYSRETAKSSPAKVILGSYATPMQARLVSDTLIEMDLNVSPFIKERNGRYVLQVGSFSDSSKAQGLVDELRSRGFDARAVNE